MVVVPYLLILVEIISVAIISALPARKSYPAQKFGDVLGVQIAQDTATTDQSTQAQQDQSPQPTPDQNQQPDSTPVDTQSPTDTQSPAPTPIDQAPTDLLQSPQIATPTESPTGIVVSPSPDLTNGTGESPSHQEQTTQTTEEQMQFNTQLTVALNASELTTSPDYISANTVQEMQNEDQVLNSQTTPEDQTAKLLQFSQDKVQAINKLSNSDNFASADFVTQRLNDQIDQIEENLKRLPQGQIIIAKTRLENICQFADPILRTSETSAPDELEQDMEITRGNCSSINQ